MENNDTHTNEILKKDDSTIAIIILISAITIVIFGAYYLWKNRKTLGLSEGV